MKALLNLKRKLGFVDLKNPSERFIHSLTKLQIYAQQIENGEKTFTDLQPLAKKHYQIVLETAIELGKELPYTISKEKEVLIAKQLLTIATEMNRDTLTQKSIDAIKYIKNEIEKGLSL